MLFYDEKGQERQIRFRPYKKEDFPSFCRCIEDFYDDGYPYKEYLDEAFQGEENEKGNLMTLCAVTSQEEIVSTSAVRFDTEFPGSGLLLLRVVRQAYRGMGIGSAQEDHLLSWIRNRQAELSSLYADVMTHNDISQGSLIRRGFVFCGLRPMLYRAPVMVPRLSWAENSRISQAVLCKRESMRDAGRLYCPEEQREAVKKLYEQLQVSVEILSPHQKEPDEKEVLEGQACCQSFHVDRQHHSGIWMLERGGRDFEACLSQAEEPLRLWRDGVVVCYLNLKDPQAPFIYERLKERGFFFTGLKPLQRDREYMMLSCLGRQSLQTENIHLYQGGGWLFEYIKKQEKRERRKK